MGPPAGAAMFALAAGLPFIVDSLSFIVAALLVARIPGHYRAERPEGGPTGLRREVTDGLRFILGHRVLRWTTPMAGLTNLAAFAIIAIFVLYAQDVLGLDAFGYGVLLSSLGVGGLVGAIVAGTIVGRLGAAGAIRITLLIGVLSALVFALVTNPIAAGIAIAAFGFQVTLWNVTVVSLRQELVPDRLRGRVAGASRLVTWGVQPLGALAGGLLASAFGLRAPFAFAVVVLAAAAVIAWIELTPQTIETAKREAAASAG
jgi:predicted MFS family arabinose efflux permease